MKYMDAMANGQETDTIIEKCKFFVSIIIALYLPNGMAYLGGQYWEKKKVFLFLRWGYDSFAQRFDGAEFPENFHILD